MRRAREKEGCISPLALRGLASLLPVRPSSISTPLGRARSPFFFNPFPGPSPSLALSLRAFARILAINYAARAHSGAGGK